MATDMNVTQMTVNVRLRHNWYTPEGTKKFIKFIDVNTHLLDFLDKDALIKDGDLQYRVTAIYPEVLKASKNTNNLNNKMQLTVEVESLSMSDNIHANLTRNGWTLEVK